jgi:hypothetical protein
MSSLRRIQTSKSNGALSKGPATPSGKQRSSLNAIRHGLCAKCIVLDHESPENFLLLLQQHLDRFRPAGEVECGMIEEMCAAYWRQRRAWSLETAMFNERWPVASPSLSLLHCYETRLHLMYQRALRTLIMLRSVEMPNEPSPISEHSETAIPPACTTDLLVCRYPNSRPHAPPKPTPTGQAYRASTIKESSSSPCGKMVIQ